MRLLVCGGRDFQAGDVFFQAMEALPFEPSLIIQGGARGADTLAKNWAYQKGVHCAEIRAMWHIHHKSAGMKRNRAMLQLRPDYVLAMPGGNGTDSMCDLATKQGVPVWRPWG